MMWMHSLVWKFSFAPRIKRLKKLLPDASIHPVGSRYVCTPPVLFTDIDLLVYAENNVDEILASAGYVKTEPRLYLGQDDESFFAWRRGSENLIVTSSLFYATTFQTATHICKRFNIREKITRVSVHEVMREKMPPDHWQFDVEGCEGVRELLKSLRGPNGTALHKLYRIQHNLEL